METSQALTAGLRRIVPRREDLQPLDEFIKELELKETEISKDPYERLGRIFVRFASDLAVKADCRYDFYQQIAELKRCGKLDDKSLVTMAINHIMVTPKLRKDGSVDPLPLTALK